MWEDQSLLNWDSNDYRLFAGDLGNDVTDEVFLDLLFPFDSSYNFNFQVLSRTFGRYPSFQMAKVLTITNQKTSKRSTCKVVRDKRSNKTKGYGFVSFKSPDDFTKAIKEMNGRMDKIFSASCKPLVFRSICGLQTDQAEQVQLERQECGCCERETAPEEEDGLQILSDCQCPFVTLLFELQNRSISLSSTIGK